MDEKKMYELVDLFLGAWNKQDVDLVADTYTEDVFYRDPNTRGPIQGRDDFKRYLAKLFDAWDMTWSLREAFIFEGGGGCAALWHASIKKAGGEKTAEIDGMDLVLVSGDRISRNEVYFDRAALLPLMEDAG